MGRINFGVLRVKGPSASSQSETIKQKRIHKCTFTLLNKVVWLHLVIGTREITDKTSYECYPEMITRVTRATRCSSVRL